MKRMTLKSMMILIAGMIVISTAVEAGPRRRPSAKHVWVKPHKLSNGIVVAGQWRLQTRTGFVWISGSSNAGGHWKPVGKAPKGKVWVSGHFNKKRKWIPGHWKRV